MRLTDEALRLIKKLAGNLGISEAAVLEIAIRNYAKDSLSLDEFQEEKIITISKRKRQ